MNEIEKIQENLVSKEFLSEIQDGWLKYIQLLQSKSTLVETPPDLPEDIEDPEAGMFWLGQDQMLGRTERTDRGKLKYAWFDAVPVLAMPHASLMENKEVVLESFKEDHLFEEIKKADYDYPRSVPRVGGDILFYLPQHTEFGFYFFYGTGLSCFKQLFKNLMKPVTIRSKFVPGKRGTFWAPSVYPGKDFDEKYGMQAMPDQEEAQAEIQRFANRKNKTREEASSSDKPR